jgi:NADPH-dependent glutamate synthase beta subunit-like oxidoreductase/ferredoxin
MALHVTIDGRTVEVEHGATILDAARKLGIEIPTLCNLPSRGCASEDERVEGVAPFGHLSSEALPREGGSCFLCVVRVEGRRNLVPSCVAPAADGMVVTTQSDEIRAARRTALELFFSDHVGDCVAPCTLACPAGMDIPAMNRRISAGDPSGALEVIRERIPFAGALGRICPRFCERVCRRGELDQPIAICALKRFPADAALNEPCEGSYKPSQGLGTSPTGKKVAIVGAGPAGLSAAFYLLREGHACTIFDANAEPGGLLRYAVPEFRLPKRALQAEIQVVRDLGAEFRMNQRLGDDLDFERLRREHDAVFLALGTAITNLDITAETQRTQRTEPGLNSSLCASAVDLGGCEQALAFLRQIAEGQRSAMPQSVVVLGGGDEAVAAAQTALRLGARRVTLVSETTRERMACFSECVDAAEAEGVKLELSAKFVHAESISDANTRVVFERNGATFSIEAGRLIAAPQRRADVEFFKKLGLNVTARGIAADRQTLATNLSGVFAGGECVGGPGAAVRAVAAGRLAALSIGQFLRGEPVVGERKPLHVLMGKLSDAEHAALFRDFVRGEKRAEAISLDAARRRATFDEVTAGLSEAEAVREARRCIQCDCLAKDNCGLRRYGTEYGAEPAKYKGERRAFARDNSHPEIVYESGKCILCGLCVRIAEQEGERPGIAFAGRGFPTVAAVPFDKLVAEGLARTGAKCAAACPTGALARKRGPWNDVFLNHQDTKTRRTAANERLRNQGLEKRDT